MSYKELTDTEIQINVVERIADQMISIAHGNADFICTDCLETLDVLRDVLMVLDSDTAVEVMCEVDEILKR